MRLRRRVVRPEWYEVKEYYGQKSSFGVSDLHLHFNLPLPSGRAASRCRFRSKGRSSQTRLNFVPFWSGRLLSREEAHIWKVFEVLVLCPNRRVVAHCCGVNDAVGQRQGITRRFKGQRLIEVNKLTDLHHAGDL